MKLNRALNVVAELLLLVQKVRPTTLRQIESVSSDHYHYNDLISNQSIENIVGLNDVSASWEENSSRKTLEHINLKIKPGQLYAFIGPVGAGKVLMNFQ